VDKIIIKDLSARGIIGINDWERENPQEMVINLILYADIRSAAKSDDIAESVNYRTIAKKTLDHAETAGRLTVEALASDIARLCLSEPGVERVIVRVEKPGAVRFSHSVGVEIDRQKGDFP
jgi:FolB domain-containing protein